VAVIHSVTFGLTAATLAAALTISEPSPAPTATRSRLEDVRTALPAARTNFVNAIKVGDAQAVANMFSSDAVIVGYDNAVTTGRVEIALSWARIFQVAQVDETLDSDKVVLDEDMAVDMGAIRIAARVSGQPPLDVVGRYLIVWELSDGSWKLRRFAYTADDPVAQSRTD